MVCVRMRLWFLGSTPKVSVGVVIDEIAEAIGQRRPNGDDLAVIDRVVQTADPTQYARTVGVKRSVRPRISRLSGVSYGG